MHASRTIFGRNEPSAVNQIPAPEYLASLDSARLIKLLQISSDLPYQCNPLLLKTLGGIPAFRRC
jgi:hypothetical protein